MEWLWIIGGIAIIWFIGWASEKVDENKNLKSKNDSLQEANNQLSSKVSEWENYSADLDKKDEEISRKESLFQQLFKERTKNFPIVGQIWGDLSEIADSERARALQYKSRPALVAAKEVSAIKKEKRELIHEVVFWKYKAQNYEAIYPWLEEELSADIEDEVNSDIYYSVYTEKERIDPVTTLINPDDYRKLSVTQRNQLALDRYWQRGKRTKWMIGKMYERYIGYLYEKDGWDVQYFGIHKRFEDLGRDLIATKSNLVHDRLNFFSTTGRIFGRFAYFAIGQNRLG